MPTVAQIFARTLSEIGVRYVFGVPSGNMIDYIEAIRNESGIDFVLVGHESTAAFMADVCGRLTGIPGVCFATFGPGATNLSTGVGGALLDRSPLIAFTDEMPEHLQNRTVQMNINHQHLFYPITKWTSRLSANCVKQVILKGANKAMEEWPGSVHIGVPAGMAQNVEKEDLSTIDYLRVEKKRWAPLVEEQLEKCSGLWHKSKMPLLAVGLSAVRAGVQDLLIEVAQKYKLPVVLTPMAKGMLSETHKSYAGVLFHALSDYVAKTYREADLIIGVGYDPVEFNYEDWMPKVPLIHIDSRQADVDAVQIPEVVNIVGSISEALKCLLKLDGCEKSWDLESISRRKEEMLQRFTPKSNSFGPIAAVEELRKQLPGDGILCVDVGAHLHLIGQQWRTPKTNKLLMTNGWSSMGFAIPAAMGAKLCHPNLPVVALMGDGGFNMMVGELATAKRLELNIVFVVIYDNNLSLIKIKQEKKNFNNSYGTALNKLPEEPTNHYFDVPVIRTHNLLSYKDALSKALKAAGPVLIEAVVDEHEYKDLVLRPNN